MPESALTKSDVLAALRTGGAAAVARLKAMPADSFEAGRYENGWNGRQILAHLASIEWTYPRLIDVARDGPPPAKPAAAPAVPSTPSAPILSYNDRQVEQRANATVDELLTEFEANRKTTITAVESADEALFSQPVKSAGGARGTLAEVLNYVAVLHVAQHVQDITGPPA